MNEKENSLRILFIEAVEITDAPGRAAYLQRACGDDVSLRQRVEKLLKAHDDEGGFVGADGGAVILPVTEKPGDCIGRYKLREQIGEGGCGVVYVAEQEEPVRRRVALKVIKLGMDTKQVVARFEAERQALAMMDHPNIARVLDAGATDTGRPYFVMELVRGIKITDYCDQNTLSTKQRLELFIQVCHAIQHAHQKGIIHRDIKPSNVLVTLHDAVPVPKVIDFGVAKATEGRLTELTVYTELHQFIGTPAYMSPEQAGRSGLDIDTRSDIYSLGVLLYELLTGKTPFDSEQLLRAGLDEMRRILLEVDPVRPSTRVSTLAMTDAPAVARTHGDKIPTLANLIRGDLDWIIMKALEKDRTRRYETANALANDLERHMGNEPVVARPPGNLYRLQKWVRRNKLAFAAASAVAASLVIGLGLSTWLFLRERTALQTADKNASRAEEEAARSRQVAEFMRGMLKGVGPAVALGRDTVMLREILDQTAERVSKELTNQPAIEAELRETIGDVYYDLGNYEKSAAMHREALALRRQLLGNEHPDVARSLNALARVLDGQGQLAESGMIFHEALAMRRKLLGNEHPDVARSLHNVGAVLHKQAKLAEAETMIREALAMQRKLLGDEHPDVSGSLHSLAVVLRAQGKLAESETMGREVLVMKRKHFGSDHPVVAHFLNYLALVLSDQGKLAEAETMQREALAMKRKHFGSEHPTVAWSLNDLATLLFSQRNLAEAETIHREALAMQRKLLGDEHPDVSASLNNLALVLRDQSKLAEAETMGREALAMRRKHFGSDHPAVAGSLGNLATVLISQRKPDEAETIHREALAMQRKLLGDEHPDVSASLNNLALVLRDQGKLAEAETMGREALAMRRKQFGSDHPVVADSLTNVAGVLRAQGKLAEAETMVREALAMRRKHFGSDHPAVADLLNCLAVVLGDQGKLAESETMHREVLVMRRKLQGNEHPDVTDSLSNLAGVLHEQGKLTEMIAHFREMLALARQSPVRDPPTSENRLSEAADILYRHNAYVEAEPFYREVLQSRLRRLSADDDRVLLTTADLARLLTEWAWADHSSISARRTQRPELAARAREAERLLRDVIAAGAGQPANRQTAESKSRLGGALVAVAVADPDLDRRARLGKFTEAEPLLLEGIEGVQENQSGVSRHRRDALIRLVRLYEAWDKLAPNTGRAARAAEWKKKLAEFGEAEPDRKAPASKP